MSSILKALEQADRERSQDSPNFPAPEYSPTTATAQRPWIWLLAGLMIGLLIWFAPKLVDRQSPTATNEVNSSDPTPPVEQPTTTQLTEAPQPLEPKPVPVQAKPSDPPLWSQAAPLSNQPVEQKPVMASSPVPAVSEPDNLQPEAALIQEETIETAEDQKPILAALKPPIQTKPPVVETLAPRADTMPDNVAQITAPKPAAAPKSPEITAPTIWEIPDQQREKISDLKIIVHVYHEDDARRYVLMNMKRYREGDLIKSHGVTLKAITRDGVIIDYGDGLVRLDAR